MPIYQIHFLHQYHNLRRNLDSEGVGFHPSARWPYPGAFYSLSRASRSDPVRPKQEVHSAVSSKGTVSGSIRVHRILLEPLQDFPAF